MKLLLITLAWHCVIAAACGGGLIILGARRRRAAPMVIGSVLVLGGVVGGYLLDYALREYMIHLGNWWYPLAALGVIGCACAVYALGVRSHRLALISLGSAVLLLVLSVAAWQHGLSRTKAALSGLDTLTPAKFHAMVNPGSRFSDLKAAAAAQRAQIAQLRAVGENEARAGLALGGILAPVPLLLGLIGLLVGRRARQRDSAEARA